MKRSVTSGLILTFAAALVASGPSALAGSTDRTSVPFHPPATTYSVTVTGMPANQVSFGNEVTFTAHVTILPPNTAASGAKPYSDARLRYTFKAQMTSPCAGMNPITIALSSILPVASWNAPKPGNYTVTVHVTKVISPIPSKPKEVIGDGTLSYSVTGEEAQPPGLPINGITTVLVPASGSASAPVDVTITASTPSVGYAAIYTFTAQCESLNEGLPFCGMSTQTVSIPPDTMPSVTLHPPLHMATSANYFIDTSGWITRQSDCQITVKLYTDERYMVNP